MLCHNRDRKKVAIPQPRDNPPSGSKHTMQQVSPANAGRVTGVQNGFVVVPSVPDGGSKILSQSESATPEQFCTIVSPATAGSRMLFENLVKFETRCAQRVSKVSG